MRNQAIHVGIRKKVFYREAAPYVTNCIRDWPEEIRFLMALDYNYNVATCQDLYIDLKLFNSCGCTAFRPMGSRTDLEYCNRKDGRDGLTGGHLVDLCY